MMKTFDRNPALVVTGRPKSALAEQFRTLRTNIQFSMVGENLKSMVITSAGVGAGKSVIAANLAAAFASDDRRVLLVDADLRKPTVHQTYRLENKSGFTTLLMYPDTKLSDLVYETQTEGLYLLTSGPIPENPADLLASKQTEFLKDEMEEVFDLVIFDMPPILPVTDAQIMASKVDGTIFVIESSGVTKGDVFKAQELLEMAEAPVIGAVLNRVKKSSKNYYSYED